MLKKYEELLSLYVNDGITDENDLVELFQYLIDTDKIHHIRTNEKDRRLFDHGGILLYMSLVKNNQNKRTSRGPFFMPYSQL